MGASRSIKGESPCAYRVVKEAHGRTYYYGPYSTLGAAKGKKTVEGESWYGESYKVWIEKTPDGWEKVEV